MTVGNQFARFGTTNMVLPPEGPRVLPFIYDFQTAAIIDQDLVLPIQNGVIESIQTMFVDNSTNPNALTINVGEKGQTIVFPPRSQGYVPILFNDQDGTFTFSTTQGVGVVVNVFFANVPIMPIIWRVT